MHLHQNPEPTAPDQSQHQLRASHIQGPGRCDRCYKCGWREERKRCASVLIVVFETKIALYSILSSEDLTIWPENDTFLSHDVI
jgi:hypothetical protein